MEEQWKICGGGKYAVSNTGKVKNRETGELLKTYVKKMTASQYVRLNNENKSDKSLASLVLEAFVGRPPAASRPRPSYRDGDFKNCSLDNLYWDDHRPQKASKTLSAAKSAFLNKCKTSPPCASCRQLSTEYKLALEVHDFDKVDALKKAERQCEV